MTGANTFGYFAENHILTEEKSYDDTNHESCPHINR
jgi:hypothetical protein